MFHLFADQQKLQIKVSRIWRRPWRHKNYNLHGETHHDASRFTGLDKIGRHENLAT